MQQYIVSPPTRLHPCVHDCVYICVSALHRTPLHLAVAYSNPAMLRYLISNGASLFLLTREGESPLKIGLEEYQLQQKTGDRASTVLEQCIEYLMGKVTSENIIIIQYIHT